MPRTNYPRLVAESDEELAEKPRPGRASWPHPEASAGLEGQRRAGRVATLEDPRRYLADRWSSAYGSVNGVWWQLRQRGARPKTGRRRHAQAEPVAEEAFRRGLRGAAAR